MSERYLQLLKFYPENPEEDVPVIMIVGALLKDTVKNRLLAQMKLKNISDTTVRSVKTSIYPEDVNGQIIGKPIEHQYLNLKIEKGIEFGQNDPVVLPELCTQFRMTVDEVIFDDESLWKKENGWGELPPLESFSDTSLSDLEKSREAICENVEEKAEKKEVERNTDKYTNYKKPNKKVIGSICIIAVIAVLLVIGIGKSHSDDGYYDDIPWGSDIDAVQNTLNETSPGSFMSYGDSKEQIMLVVKDFEGMQGLDGLAFFDCEGGAGLKSVLLAFPFKDDSKVSADEFTETISDIYDKKYGKHETKDVSYSSYTWKTGKSIITLEQLSDGVAGIIFKDKNNKENVEVDEDTFKSQSPSGDHLSAGGFTTIGLLDDNTVVSIGSNYFGQCDVSDWAEIEALSAGAFHNVGLRSDGTVVAAGCNDDGQCNVSGWNDIVKIFAGEYSTIGITKDGEVVATGDNRYGECNVSMWSDIKDIGVGYTHTVGLKNDGTVVSTGRNSSGECDVSTWKKMVDIDAGESHTVGLKSDGTVIATGSNTFGQCDVTDWKDIVAVSAGYRFTVGLKSDGSVVATNPEPPQAEKYADNDYGQSNVSSWNNIIAVSAGTYHTVGLKKDGSVVSTKMKSTDKDMYAGQDNVAAWSLKTY